MKSMRAIDCVGPALCLVSGLMLLWALPGMLEPVLQSGLDSGNAHHPPLGYGYFLGFWGFYGLVAAGLIAYALAQGWGLFRPRLPSGLFARTDIAVLVSAVLAVLAAIVVRELVFWGVMVTDDEPVYRFAAELLASGRLSVPSHPEALFFDRAFMVNDGRYYTQYFLGWPAVLVPGVWLGAEQYTNAILGGLTIPALYRIVEPTVSRRAAVVTCLVYLFSPMALMANATMMSHTSCMFICAWMVVCFLRARDQDSSQLWYAAVATLFSIAFFIRPLTAAALGSFLLLWLLAPAIRARRGRALGAFAVPSVVFAGLFFAVNAHLTGSALYVPYQAAYHYSVENDYRFSHIPIGYENAVINMNFNPLRALEFFGISMYRFNFAAFGWPLSFLFLPLARASLGARIGWVMFANHALFHFWVTDGGVDVFGPPHFFELLLPLLLLTGAGFEWLAQKLAQQTSPAWPRYFPSALVITLVSISWVYTTQRLEAAEVRAKAIARPIRAVQQFVEQQQPGKIILFRVGQHATTCGVPAGRHFVFWPPHNDPDLNNDVIWANHLTIDRDRALVDQHFEDRQGFLYWWAAPCDLQILPLRDPRADQLPEAKESNPSRTWWKGQHEQQAQPE